MAEANGQNMPKVEVDKVTATQRLYMKKLEQSNIERASRLKNVRRNSTITGVLLAGMVVGIYIFTIKAVKQETFLDEFEEPVKATPMKGKPAAS